MFLMLIKPTYEKEMNKKLRKSGSLFFFSDSVRLAIRKLTYAPYRNRPQPTIEVTKEFLISSGSLHLEASLDKEVVCLFF